MDVENGLALDYRLSLWDPTSALRAISVVAEFLVDFCYNVLNWHHIS